MAKQLLFSFQTPRRRVKRADFAASSDTDVAEQLQTTRPYTDQHLSGRDVARAPTHAQGHRGSVTRLPVRTEPCDAAPGKCPFSDRPRNSGAFNACPTEMGSLGHRNRFVTSPYFTPYT